MTRTERAGRIVTELARIYPDAHCELNYRNPLELLVATILSAQCTDKRVNLVTPALFETYPSAADLAGAPLYELEKLIQSTGFFRAKARNIQSAARDIVDRFGGQIPRSLAELITLAGVGRKTANVVLGNAFQLDEGIVVDTHVSRLSRRFHLTKQNHPEKIELDLIKLVPKAQWTNFSHWLIWHGRRRCFARKPDCEHCELAEICPSYKKV